MKMCHLLINNCLQNQQIYEQIRCLSDHRVRFSTTLHTSYIRYTSSIYGGSNKLRVKMIFCLVGVLLWWNVGFILK